MGKLSVRNEGKGKESLGGVLATGLGNETMGTKEITQEAHVWVAAPAFGMDYSDLWDSPWYRPPAGRWTGHTELPQQ